MATFRFTGGVSRFKTKLVDGMVRNGYTTEFAEKTFSQLEGFGSYGFPENHAASFALIAYASCYVKCHFPDAFCAALLNSQPMGFYAPAQIVADARAHGVVRGTSSKSAMSAIGPEQTYKITLLSRLEVKRLPEQAPLSFANEFRGECNESICFYSASCSGGRGNWNWRKTLCSSVGTLWACRCDVGNHYDLHDDLVSAFSLSICFEHHCFHRDLSAYRCIPDQPVARFRSRCGNFLSSV
jgi:hypothetical protein